MYHLLFLSHVILRFASNCAVEDAESEGTAEQSQQPTSSEPGSSLTTLDLQLQQLSVFASQRRLCTAAALLTVVQQVQDGLRSMTKPRTSTAAEIAVSNKVTLPLLKPLSSCDMCCQCVLHAVCWEARSVCISHGTEIGCKLVHPLTTLHRSFWGAILVTRAHSAALRAQSNSHCCSWLWSSLNSWHV